MEGLDLEHTVDEFIDAFSSNMAVCADCLMRWLKDLRRCAMKVIRSLVRYFQSGREVILHSQELADYLTPVYYAPDYLDIDGMKELMGLLREADNLEQCLDVEEQRRFFHEYNHQLDRAVRRVHDALMGNMPDRAFAMRRKVARLRSDVQEIIRREERRWTEGLRIDPYATEEELLREAIDCVEGELSQSLFYCNGADTLMKVVEHILSLTNERIGAQLDQFLYNYAQLYWLRQRLENIEIQKQKDMKKEEMEEMQKMHCHTYVAAGAVHIGNIEHVENLYPGSPELLQKKAEPEKLTDDVLRDKINRVLPRINANRLWFCIVKVLMLRGVVAYDDFEGAKALIDRLYPSGYPNPFDPYDLRKLHDGCFRLPLNEWQITTSPYKRPAEFKAYHNLATEFDALF